LTPEANPISLTVMPLSLTARLGGTSLAAAGAMFVLYPALRPWHDESTVDGAIASMSSGAWVAAHLFGMIGFILAALGVLALRDVVAGTRAHRTAAVAVVTTWIGAGLTLPYFGAEDFALHAIAGRVAPDQVLDLVEAVRYNPVGITMFGLGLLLLAVGGGLTAVAVARSGVLPRLSGLAYALGFVLFLPQFFGPPPVRIAHGVLLGLGSLWLAVGLWRRSAPAPTRPCTVEGAAAT
jgi:hypothetical protein